MTLWLIRHAEAEPRDPEVDDARRALTVAGKKRWRRAVRGLERLEVSFERVYHSPMLRAVETAAALTALAAGDIAELSGLAEPPDAQLVAGLAAENVALVGHEPWLSQLLALLVAGSTAQAGRFAMKKGGVAQLEGAPQPGAMTLVALYPPRALRRLGRGV